MPRSDVHRDALARELGATHYQSAHGKAAESHTPGRGAPARARSEPRRHYGRYQQRVGDVMTAPVVTVSLRTPCKRIVVLLAQHQISAVPVLVLGRHVAGVVSEADLLAAQDRRLRDAQLEAGGHFRRHARPGRHQGLTAGELMTSPAITIHPDAPLPAAARLMISRTSSGCR